MWPCTITETHWRTGFHWQWQHIPGQTRDFQFVTGRVPELEWYNTTIGRLTRILTPGFTCNQHIHWFNINYVIRKKKEQQCPRTQVFARKWHIWVMVNLVYEYKFWVTVLFNWEFQIFRFNSIGKSDSARVFENKVTYKFNTDFTTFNVSIKRVQYYRILNHTVKQLHFQVIIVVL